MPVITNFRGLIFRGFHTTAKNAKITPPRKYPLYGVYANVTVPSRNQILDNYFITHFTAFNTVAQNFC